MPIGVYKHHPNQVFKKGHVPRSKGLKGIYHHTEESKKKFREIKKEYFKTHVQWNKNKKCPQLSEALKGRKAWNKNKSNPYAKNLPQSFKNNLQLKEKNINWKGGITPLRMQIRHSFKYRQWISDVFTRDNFTCQNCGTKGCILNAHHAKSFSKIIEENKITTFEQALGCEELWNINNGKTLCERCHNKLRERGKQVQKLANLPIAPEI